MILWLSMMGFKVFIYVFGVLWRIEPRWGLTSMSKGAQFIFYQGVLFLTACVGGVGWKKNNGRVGVGASNELAIQCVFYHIDFFLSPFPLINV